MSKIIPPFISNTPPPLPPPSSDSFDDEEFGVFCGYDTSFDVTAGNADRILSSPVSKITNENVKESSWDEKNNVEEISKEESVVDCMKIIEAPDIKVTDVKENVPINEEHLAVHSPETSTSSFYTLHDNLSESVESAVESESYRTCNGYFNQDESSCADESILKYDSPDSMHENDSNDQNPIQSNLNFEELHSKIEPLSDSIEADDVSKSTTFHEIGECNVESNIDYSEPVEDDFGEFASFDEPVAQNRISSKNAETADNSFCDFQSFCQFDNSIFPRSPSHVPASGGDSQHFKFEKLFSWATKAPECTGDAEEELTEFNTFIDGADTLWNKLWNSENSHALSFQWNNSDSYHLLLASLQIDSRNILFNNYKGSHLPIFAINMGSTSLEPQKLDLYCQISPDLNIESSSELNVDDEFQETVPPALFDWSGSGLTNPLDASNIALLDLDFFNTNDYVTPLAFKDSNLTCLEKELMESEDPLSNRVDALSDLMSSTKPSTYLSNCIGNVDTLSSEAANLLKTLPSLQFMKSPVLVFPIKSFSEDLQ